MSEPLDYLKRYVGDVRLIEADALAAEDMARLPTSWLGLLKLNVRERVEATLALWRPFEDALSLTCAYLREHLLAVDVIHSFRGYSLLYTIRAQTGALMYYEGLAPGSTKATDVRVATLLAQSPEPLELLYHTLHDGFYYFASCSMGTRPMEDVFVMDLHEWGILGGKPSPIDLSLALAIFTNGMGGYLCLEFLEPSPAAHVWFSNRAPKLNVEFWPTLDTWIVLGFEA